MIELVVNYPPIPWTPPRVCSGYTYDKKALDKQKIKQLILSQYAGDLLYDAVEIELTFYFAPPKSTPKKKLPLFLKNVLHVSTRPDCTNCQKLFEDCLQGTVIANDRQVQKISSQKQWADQAYITCIIKKISYKSVGDEKK